MPACSELLGKLAYGIQRAAYSREGSAILNEYGADSWVEGGCHILLAALLRWLGDVITPVYVVGDQGLEHMIARIGNCYLDGGGAWNEKALLSAWKKHGVKNPRIEPAEVRDVEESAAASSEPVPACPQGPVLALVELFEKYVGPGEAVREAIRKS